MRATSNKPATLSTASRPSISNGLGNDGNEYKIIVQTSLYKLVCSKFAEEMKRFDPKLARQTTGSSDSTSVEISGNVLTSTYAVLPDRWLTVAFSDLLEPMIKRQQRAELENRELTQLRDWLLPLLMNGQARAG